MMLRLCRTAILWSALILGSSTAALAQTENSPTLTRAPATQAPPAWTWQPAPPVSAGARFACRTAQTAGPASRTYRLCLEGRRAGEFQLVLAEMVGPSSNDLLTLSLYEEPQLALIMLTDRRFDHFWPVIRTIGGADGRALRSEALRAQLRTARIPAAAESTFQSVVGSRLRRQLAEAAVWAWWGEGDRTMALLNAARPVPDDRGRLTEDQQYDLLSIELRRATLQLVLNDVGGAIATLRALSADSRIIGLYRLNADVNLAALLAETGQAREALTLIDRAERRFNGAGSDSAVSGSNRQFAWIRACAQHQLGLVREAQATLRTIMATPDVARNPWLPEPQETINGRSDRCMHNFEAPMQRLHAARLSPYPLPVGDWVLLFLDNPRSRVQSWVVNFRQMATAPDGPAREFVPLPPEWAWLANDRGRYRDATVL